MINIQDISKKNVLIRADLDLPVKDGRVENSYRLEALLPTLNLCLEHASKVCLIGHLGRPEFEDQPDFSLVPVVNEIKRLINRDIKLYTSGFSPGDWWKGESPLSVLDNLRFDKREESLNLEFARELATGADIYVYEAFATYRPCTSLSLIPEVLPTITGLQFDKEVSSLKKVFENAEHPTLLIGSGAKADKLDLLRTIAPRFDEYFFGGVFAKVSDLLLDGLDLNSQATGKVLELINESKTIVLNGPLGKYEDNIHSVATKAVLEALTDPKKYTIVGGGDTLASIPYLGFNYTQYGFVSTGGGAMLEYLSKGTHPFLEVLKNANLKHG